MASILADMRRTVWAILWGVVVSGWMLALFTNPLMAVSQEVVGRLLPAAVSDSAYHLAVELVTFGLLAVPGVAVAVLLARRRDYPSGHCRRGGYNLRGNVSGVCPECGRGI